MAHLPGWKKAVLRKKEQDKLADQLAAEAKQREEDIKWEGVPEWKRKILREKVNFPLFSEITIT